MMGPQGNQHLPCTMSATFLIIGRYPSDSPLHKSDQVTVPVPIWEELYGSHEGGERPLFVQLNATEDGPFARLRPAVGVGLSADSCQIPEWMWLLLGAPEPNTWVSLTVSELPDAGSIKLRPRRAATLAGLAEPLIHLTEELTGGVSGQSWACLSAGAELPLVCGAFDVLEITSVEGYPVPAACILDLDVDLELEPALDSTADGLLEATAASAAGAERSRQETYPVVRSATPPPAPPAVLLPAAGGAGAGDTTALLRAAAAARAARAAPQPQGMSFPGLETLGQPDTRFPGTGRRLGGP